MRAGTGLQRDVRKTRDLGERALQPPHEIERVLRVVRVLQRMETGMSGQGSHPLMELRVVLHRAGTERVEALVEVEVLRRQRRVVAYELRLRDLGELGRAVPDDARRKQLVDRHRRDVGLGGDERAAALPRALEDRECVLVRAGIEVAAHYAVTASGTDFTADARRSMSAFVRRSVIATSRPSSY